MPVEYNASGDIERVHATSVLDAKLTLQQLKLKKIEYEALKNDALAHAPSRNAKRGFAGKISLPLRGEKRKQAQAQQQDAIRSTDAQAEHIEQMIDKINQFLAQLERYLADKS